MQWDLGLQGLAALAALSLGCGFVAGLLVGQRVGHHRLWATAITTLACFGVGLLISEGLFGWATEEELQPNIDGLSWDEAFLSNVLTTVVIVLVMRFLARRAGNQKTPRHWRLIGRHDRPTGHA